MNELTVTETKTLVCKYCHQEKPLSEFRGDKRTKSGVIRQCKSCRRKMREENGEYLRERIRKHEMRAKPNSYLLITTDQLKKLLKQRRCTYCGCELTESNTTVDHVYPLSDGYGGGNSYLNVVVACRSCNASKGNRHVYEFYRASDRFTDELWTKFVRMHSERLFERKLTDEQVEAMKRNFAAEYEELKSNELGQRKERAMQNVL